MITLLLAHHLHGDRLSRINMFGLVLCITGMLIHGAAKHNRKKLIARMTALNGSNTTADMDAQRMLLVEEQHI